MASQQHKNYTLLPRGEAEALGSEKNSERSSRSWSQSFSIPCLTAVLVLFTLIILRSKVNNDAHSPALHVEACPQFPALEALSSNPNSLENSIQRELSSDGFFKASTKRMQGAIQIATESFDDMGEIGEDERWEVFIGFQEYLNKTFPLVYSQLNVKYINSYGLFIEWKGIDDSLKPYLFMGHQDVVPVLPATVGKWTYPPYSAYFDGRFIWGRGGSDCKNVVIGVLEAFEILLEKNHKPQRTMLVAFGFDEEINGPQGAGHLSKYIEDSRGSDSLDLIIDEGGLGIKQLYGAMFVQPGLGEKGYLDIKITVETKGGHSSVPPDYTGIGILSRIVAAIEDNPYKPELTPVNPYFTTLQCGAEYGSKMDSNLRTKIRKSLTSKKAAKSVANQLAEEDIFKRYLMQTSQAPDLVLGGVKVNALPEKVYAVINYRVAVESRIKDIQSDLVSVIESNILNNFQLKLDAWGSVSGNTSTTSAGTITLDFFTEPTEPSPVSPQDTDAYRIFTGTIKQVFGKDYVVAPSLMTGNTDTKFYWNLSKNIYRFSPVRDEGRANAHTVDERIGMKEHVEGVQFYVQMVLNGDRK